MLWFTCSLGVDHFLTKRGVRQRKLLTFNVNEKKKILIKVKWMWSLGPPVISLYVLIQSAGLLFCVFYSVATIWLFVFFALWPWVFRFYIPTSQYQRGSREHDTGFSSEGIVNFIGFIKKRSCQLLLFLNDARTHFQVWCIFLGWTSFNFI